VGLLYNSLDNDSQADRERLPGISYQNKRLEENGEDRLGGQGNK